MTARPSSFTLLQASQNAPVLARLMDMHRQSSERLQAVRSLIPTALHPAIQAGPLQDGVWCLLLANTATAAKMRQLVSALEAHLRSCGLPVQSIRLKVSREGYGQGKHRLNTQDRQVWQD